MTKELLSFENIILWLNANEPKGILLDDISVVKKGLKALEIIKPLCELYESENKELRYLIINGVIIYEIKSQDEWDLLQEALNENKG